MDLCDQLFHKVEHAIHKMEDFVDEHMHKKDKRSLHDIGVIMAPFNKGQPMKGTEKAPSAIKDTGFIQKLIDWNFTVEEFGEVTMQPTLSVDIGPNDMLNFKQVFKYCQLLSQKVKDVLEQKSLCITLGGDHAITMGCINGLADLDRNHQVKVIYIDAHADIHMGSSSKSNNIHGMLISFLLDRETNRLDGWPSPCLNFKDIVWIALRDVDPAEQEFLDSTPDLLYFTMKDIRNCGMNNIIRIILEKLNPGPKNPLYLSFDIDALDPSIAPSTGCPVDGGMTLDEGKMIIQKAYSTGYLRCIDITEVNPEVGSKSDVEKTVMAAYDLILSIANDK